MHFWNRSLGPENLVRVLHGDVTWGFYMGMLHGNITWEYYMGILHGNITWESNMNHFIF